MGIFPLKYQHVIFILTLYDIFCKKCRKCVILKTEVSLHTLYEQYQNV
jgi:hypothetical protein